MPQPAQRYSRHWKGHRRSHDHLKQRNLSKCRRCGLPKLPHRVCSNCGFYGEERVIDMTER